MFPNDYWIRGPSISRRTLMPVLRYVRVASLLLVAMMLLNPLMSLAASAPQTSTNSIPSPTLRTNLSLSTLKSTITLLTPKGCYQPGDKLSILGKNFGKQTSSKRIVLTDKRTHFVVSIQSWSDRQIDVNLVNKRIFTSGVSYFIGVQKTDRSAWLSNLFKGVVFCRTTTQTTTSRSTSIPSETSSQISNAPDVHEGDEWQYDDYEEGGSAGTQQRMSDGSLLKNQLPPAPVVPAVIRKEKESVEPGEILIMTDSMPAAKQVQAKLSSEEFSVIRRKKLKNLGLVLSTYRTPDGMLVSEALKTIRQLDPKLWVDANGRYGLNGNTAQKGNDYSFKLMGWPSKRNNCGEKIRIGMIDTHVDIDHRVFKEADITAKSFVPNGVKQSPGEHGTALASLLVGKSRKDHYQGLLPKARLYSAGVFRVRDDDSIDTTSELLVKSVDWLVGQKVSVINMSLGGQRNLILEAALKQAMRSGVVVVAAAGNNGSNAVPVYPAAQKRVIAVTAVDAQKKIYYKANQGKYIDFSAPGVDIWLLAKNGKFQYFSGTSYATPFVTVVAALAKKKSKSYSSLMKVISQKSKDLGEKGRDNVYGRGLVLAGGLCRVK